MSIEPPGLAVVILAGGNATRLPGKLVSDAGGVPLLVRVYRNVRTIGPAYVSARGPFPDAVDAALTCPIVIDRQPGLGPLGGLCTTFAIVRAARVFVVAGDAPFVTADTAAELQAAWTPQTQAVLALNAEGRAEPLCAIYDRAAFLREAHDVLEAGTGAVRAVAERLHSTHLQLRNQRALFNLNTPADRDRLSGFGSVFGDS